MAFPAKLVAVSSLMTFWIPEERIPPIVWIPVFAILPIIFNLFNVRRYGEIEFWLTTVKVVTIMGLIVLGLLLAMGASDDTRLSGTDAQYNLIPCNDTSLDDCVPLPGFSCSNINCFH